MSDYGNHFRRRSENMIKLQLGFFFLSVFLPLAVPTGCEERQTPAQQSGKTSGHEVYEGKIVAVGDSLTAGFGISEKEAYPARLQEQLASQGYRYKVVNAGISGETSSGTLSRIKWVLTLKPDIVILETGANDGLRGLPADLIEANLNELIRILKERGITVVLAGMQVLGNLGQSYTAAFKEIYPRVAEKQGVILIPFFLESVAGNPGLNQKDLIHPTPEGHEIVAKTVYPYVIEAINKHRAGKGF